EDARVVLRVRDEDERAVRAHEELRLGVGEERDLALELARGEAPPPERERPARARARDEGERRERAVEDERARVDAAPRPVAARAHVLGRPGELGARRLLGQALDIPRREVDRLDAGGRARLAVRVDARVPLEQEALALDAPAELELAAGA